MVKLNRSLAVFFLLVLCLVAVANPTPPPEAGTPIPPTFFGMHINRPNTPWPNVPFGSLRMLGNMTTWYHLEGAGRGRYDWHNLDVWLNAARSHNVDVMYTFSRTPGWAAVSTHEACGPRADSADCAPPSDLMKTAACQAPLAGVTTTDCQFKEFVTSLMSHVCSGTAPNRSCQIVAFSCWNEPNLDGFWVGTYAESAKMCADMVKVVKDQCRSCTTLTPDISAATSGDTKGNGDSRSYDEWTQRFLAAYSNYSNDYPDAGAFHPYAARTWNINPVPFPETFVGSGCPGGGQSPACPDTLLGKIATMRSILDSGGMSGKPLWATEGGWGTNGELPDPDAQAAYVARWLILQASAGVQRAYWFMWDNGGDARGWGGMWDPRNGTNKAGIAYGQVYNWLVGATFYRPCSNNQGVWTCDISRPGGYYGRIVWNALNSYDANASFRYATGADFSQYRDLAGGKASIEAGAVNIGSKPILLEKLPTPPAQHK
ncbi:MAG: hypothetical protein ABR874_08600 [Candidatus Sulfotelmatobacter sp.]|jgi:hypothetical protein